MGTACFARAPQRCTSRLSKHFLLTFKRLHCSAKLATSYLTSQEVTLLSKTRNQLMLKLEERYGKSIQFVAAIHDDHAPHRHVHALVMLNGRRLTRSILPPFATTPETARSPKGGIKTGCDA